MDCDLAGKFLISELWLENELIFCEASQIGVASLGLCYSTDLAERRARFAPGNVTIPSMATIQTAKIISSPSSERSAQQYTANR